MGNNWLVRSWVNKSMRDFHVVLGITAVVLQILGTIAKTPKYFGYGDMIALFGIIHFFVHSYFHRQKGFITDHQSHYALTEKKIMRIGALYLGIFLIIVNVGMALVKEIYSGTLLEKLKIMMIYFMKKFFGALFASGGLGKDELVVQNNNNLLGVMNMVSAKTESPWENFINHIQTVLIVIGVLLLIVFCVVAIVNSIKNVFKGRSFDTDGRRGKEVRDREERIFGRKSGIAGMLDFSPNAKARRIYRQSINRKRRRGNVVAEWMTPEEIENMVAFSEKEKREEFHFIYEKARYSESGCTDADVHRMKNLKL